ncbi:MAG: lipocalin family protein [Acidobacteriota bacterium]
MRSRLGLGPVVVLVAATTLAAPEDFRQAMTPWSFEYPRDHGSHEDFAIEWWYLVGHLDLADGRTLPYQATFFRTALDLPGSTAGRSSELAAHSSIMFHGAVCDPAAQTFVSKRRVGRAAAGWAHASTERLDVHLFADRLRQVGSDRWELRYAVEGWELELSYLLDRPPVMHGERPGLSRKGPPGHASHYVSRVQLPTSGRVKAPGGEWEKVTGISWFDQEFMTILLSDLQVGWDWFSANLDDGSALMLYQLREQDGGITAQSSGSFVHPDGRSEHLKLADFTIEPTGSWTSPHTGGTYPQGWRLSVPKLALELTVEPLLADQEQAHPGAPIIYWEGGCRYVGKRSGKPIVGRGHVELVGYAKPMSLPRVSAR